MNFKIDFCTVVKIYVNIPSEEPQLKVNILNN